MPMHDWTRVAPNYFHAFHVAWVAALQQTLNTGLLPKGYYALAEQTSPPIGPDVLTLQKPPAAGGPPPRRRPSGVAVAVAAAPPRVRFTASERGRADARPQRRVGIRHTSSHRLVAVIEIVPPANKGNARDFRRFLGKAVAVLEQRLHLLVIDPFPPTARDPHGLHAAVWKALVGKPFAPPADKPLTLAAYAAGERYTAYVEPVAVGDRLPDMPLFLDPERYVNVPLEKTYRAAWEGFPDEWRAVLE